MSTSSLASQEIPGKGTGYFRTLHELGGSQTVTDSPVILLQKTFGSFDLWLLIASGLILCISLLTVFLLIRKRTDPGSKTLLQTEKFDGQLFAKGPVALLTWLPDDGWPVIVASASVHQVLGISRKRLLSEDFRLQSIIQSGDVVSIQSRISAHLENKQYQWEDTYRIRDDHGQFRWINVCTTAELGYDQEVSCFRAYLIDITGQFLLRERSKLLASIFEYAQEGMAITDIRGIVLEVNPSFSAITGFGAQELAGKNLRILSSDRYSQKFYNRIWRILSTTGNWEGEIYSQRKNQESFPGYLAITAVRDEKDKISHYIFVITDISNIKQQELKIERLTHYDVLTSLPNRVLLVDRLHMALADAYREQQQLAVACLDLDGFKLINDTYGHVVGDTLLTLISRRLTSILTESDTLARLGGDEFVMVLGGSRERAVLLSRFDHILEQLALPCELPEVTLSLSASIGITFFPNDDADPDTLLRHADQAMYRAKQAGRSCYHIFEVKEEWELQQRFDSREEFRAALDQGELELYYQPKVDMREGLVIGMEALVRWHHPVEGLLLPASFLPTIENTDLELRLGEWVIATALDQASQWHRQGYRMTVSVNIASPHVLSQRFIPYLVEQLRRYPKLSKGALEIELLESAALMDMNEVARVLGICKELGVGIALDDFGTGYSSLAYLRSLPADTLKVDQSFVRNMLENREDLAIVEGVVSLAQVFRRRVIAEGVETTAHGLLLLRMGCNLAQGYGIARPMPTAEVLDWINNWTPEPSWLTAQTLEPTFPFC